MSHAANIRAFIQAQANLNERPKPGAGYTGSSHVHYGLTAPVLREFIKGWTKTHKADLPFEAWLTTLDDLYHGESLEERAIAGLLLAKFPAYRRQLPLDRLDEWLGQLEGWAEVDGTCQSTFTAADLLVNWDAWRAFLERLNADANIHKRRASVVLLIKPLRESDDSRLLALAFAQIDGLKHEHDGLITKALSWVLREGTKRHAAAIADYLEANADSLPAIAVRETRNKLNTGRKTKEP